MADEKPKGKGKKGKKVLGLPPVAWAGVGGGALAIWYYLRLRSNAAAAAAATGTTDGQTTPASSSGGTTTVAPTTLSQWINDALGTSTNATYTSTQLLNDINDWLGGNCVSSAGYSAIGNLVSTLGVPPGYSTTPVLSVCTSSDTGTGSGSGDGSGGSTTTTPAPSFISDLQNIAGVFQIPGAGTNGWSSNLIQSLTNNSSAPIVVSNGTQQFNVNPGESIGQAAIRIAQAAQNQVPTTAPAPAFTPGGTTPSIAVLQSQVLADTGSLPATGTNSGLPGGIAAVVDAPGNDPHYNPAIGV